MEERELSTKDGGEYIRAAELKEEISRLGWSYSVGYPRAWDRGFGFALRSINNLIDRQERYERERVQ